MIEFFKRHAHNALIGVALTSVVGAAGSLAGAALTYHYSKIGQDRQVKLEQITKFDASSTQIIDAAGIFMNAINENKDIDEARQKIRTVVAAQIHESDSVGKFFDPDVSRVVSEYQGALLEFNNLAQRTSSPLEMPRWQEGFSRALAAKTKLSRRLYSKVGVGTRA